MIGADGLGEDGLVLWRACLDFRTMKALSVMLNMFWQKISTNPLVLPENIKHKVYQVI